MKSKDAIDKIIQKSRVHLYKPIQIAEILYAYRNKQNIDPLDIETYRNTSKKWRDGITKRLVGRVSTSSQKFQDNLFDQNAMPPQLLNELAEYNNKNKGLVESYIYHKLKERLLMVHEAYEYLEKADPSTFDLNFFLSEFTQKPGLKRSIDKVYEITVYALFSTIVRALKVEVSMAIGNADKEILSDFDKFIRLVLGLSKDKTITKVPAKLFRVGVTNAADRGLDMWTNFGPAIQVKHISFTEDLAEEVCDNLSADAIVLVCLDGEATTIQRITSQFSTGSKIQGIITLADLNDWYTLCFSQKYRKNLGSKLLEDLRREFSSEFPSSDEIDPFMKERGYGDSKLEGIWKIETK